MKDQRFSTHENDSAGGQRTPPETSPHEVDVWVVELDVDARLQAALEGLLSAEEHERADRFQFAQHRRRFIVRRGSLRLILAGYVGMAPAALRFTEGPQGKPVLASGPPDEVLAFNTSHSDELGLVAVSRHDLGVDVERVAPVDGDPLVARTHLHRDEQAEMDQTSQALRAYSFFRCWVRKEAYIKARGKGLTMGLDAFSVSASAAVGAVGWPVADGRNPWADWWVRDLDPSPGYVAAVAAGGPSWQVRQKVFSPSEVEACYGRWCNLAGVI